MTDNDTKLAAYFATSEPPARDYAFTVEVMQHVARRRLGEEIAVLSLASLVGAVALWALWPVLSPALITLSSGLAPAGAAVVIVMVLGFALTGKPLFGLTAER